LIPTSASPPAEPLLTLLVDRDEDTRQMYAEYFTLCRWRVDEASDGREALAKAISWRPDVIVTETRLPGIDGFALCNLLRRDVATIAIPIIVVTADALTDDVHRAVDAGADLVLTKPCLPERLSNAAQSLIQQARDVRSRAAMANQMARDQLVRADEILSRAIHTVHHPRQTLSKAHLRGDTITPPTAPPPLVCPLCDRPLRYQRSHVGGVSSKHAEQWDYFDCEGGCGMFQYRTRTRKLRQVG
jgi:CheY-like chemotaxis protein